MASILTCFLPAQSRPRRKKAKPNRSASGGSAMRASVQCRPLGLTPWTIVRFRMGPHDGLEKIKSNLRSAIRLEHRKPNMPQIGGPLNSELFVALSRPIWPLYSSPRWGVGWWQFPGTLAEDDVLRILRTAERDGRSSNIDLGVEY
jgi:hypothetical protein